MSYVILTATAAESSRLQGSHWIPSTNLVPVSTLHRGVLETHAAKGAADLFYTDAALDALVASANRADPTTGTAIYAAADTSWRRWRLARGLFRTVRPMEAWEYLNETSLEELAGRDRASLAIMSTTTRIRAERPSLSYFDLVNFERRHAAAAIRAKAADHLIRIAPRRVVVTEEQSREEVVIRATWTALHSQDRAVPPWLLAGLTASTATLAGA